MSGNCIIKETKTTPASLQPIQSGTFAMFINKPTGFHILIGISLA
jgi:hypothetical protein